MLAIAIVSILVPAAAVGVYFASRSAMAQRLADSRGIALQTVIVMVVLLVIAGAVATVLLTRGGQAVNELDDADIVRFADIDTELRCLAAGGAWDATGQGSCTAPPP